jgi:hypothetical protein
MQNPDPVDLADRFLENEMPIPLAKERGVWLGTANTPWEKF